MQTEKKDNRKEPTKKQSLWEPVKIIIHKETKVAVRVSRLTIKPHPLYTYEIGYVDAEEQFHRFLKPKVEIDEATGKVEHNSTRLGGFRCRSFRAADLDETGLENEAIHALQR